MCSIEIGIEMIRLQETTKWDYDNHVYLVTPDKQKVLGYIKQGTDQEIMFEKPLKFDTRKRTFKELK